MRKPTKRRTGKGPAPGRGLAEAQRELEAAISLLDLLAMIDAHDDSGVIMESLDSGAFGSLIYDLKLKLKRVDAALTGEGASHE